MCDPISLGAMALSAGGAYAQGQTQANYVDAVNAANKQAYEMSKAAREAELVRQKAIEAQSNATFDATLADMTREKADATTAEAAKEFTDTLNATAKPTAGELGFLLPGQGESSVAVKDWVARAANTAAADASRRIEAIAKLSGMGTTAGARLDGMRGAQDELTTNNNIRRGSLGVSNFEQTIPAANVTPGSDILGQILSGAGMLLGSGALGGGMAMTPNGISQRAGIFDLFSDPMFRTGKFSFGGF